MEYTKEELKKAIIVIAEKYNINHSFYGLFLGNSMPEMVKLIVYEMFVKEFSIVNCSLEEINAYDIILLYAKELKEIGFVTFK
jgi:hypothetical protein